MILNGCTQHTLSPMFPTWPMSVRHFPFSLLSTYPMTQISSPLCLPHVSVTELHHVTMETKSIWLFVSARAFKYQDKEHILRFRKALRMETTLWKCRLDMLPHPTTADPFYILHTHSWSPDFQLQDKYSKYFINILLSSHISLCYCTSQTLLFNLDTISKETICSAQLWFLVFFLPSM